MILMKKRRRSQRQLMLAGSCTKPTYSRVLLSDAASGVPPVIGAVGGTFAGLAVTAGSQPTTQAVGAFVGGALGYLVGLVPGFYVQRAVLRNPACKDPSNGKILTYGAARTGMAWAARAVGKAVAGDAGGNAAALATVFVAPLVGQRILHE